MDWGPDVSALWREVNSHSVATTLGYLFDQVYDFGRLPGCSLRTMRGLNCLTSMVSQLSPGHADTAKLTTLTAPAVVLVPPTNKGHPPELDEDFGRSSFWGLTYPLMLSGGRRQNPRVVSLDPPLTGFGMSSSWVASATWDSSHQLTRDTNGCAAMPYTYLGQTLPYVFTTTESVGFATHGVSG